MGTSNTSGARTSSRKHVPLDLTFTLRRVFNKQSFRPLQRDVIEASIEGHDVFLQAATSFGKSLCYQLPAVVSHGVTIVVSPLLALIVDQVTALRALSISVATITSTTPSPARAAITTDLLSGHPRTRLLYLTPELLARESTRRIIRRMAAQGQLIRVAIDEAHCVSEWGHDFRPAYRELRWFRRELGEVPITAVTATATGRVRRDIVGILGLEEGRLRRFVMGGRRPNIHFEVRQLGAGTWEVEGGTVQVGQVRDLIAWLGGIHERRMKALRGMEGDSRPITGIVYVPLRAACAELARMISEMAPFNVTAVPYHAGMSTSERQKVHDLWEKSARGGAMGSTVPPGASQPPQRPRDLRQTNLDGRGGHHLPPPQQDSTGNDDKENGEDKGPPAFTLVIATKAFGMGIDHPHVRFVIHWTIPQSFENLIQEAGRAGRDGRASVSVVYYHRLEAKRVFERIRRGGSGWEGMDEEGIYAAAFEEEEEGGRKRKRGEAEPTQTQGGPPPSTQEARKRSHKAALESFARVVRYCEATTRCRHVMIGEFCGDKTGEEGQSTPAEGCDFACDYCKFGEGYLKKKKKAMVRSVERYEGGGDVSEEEGEDFATRATQAMSSEGSEEEEEERESGDDEKGEQGGRRGLISFQSARNMMR